MRKVFSVALMAAIVCLVGMARDASANVTFNLVWTGTSSGNATSIGSLGSDTYIGAAGDIVTLQIRMITTQTLQFHGISLNFDTDLGNELNLLGSGEWAGSSFSTGTMLTSYAPLTPGVTSTFESTGAMAGRINTYESGQLSGPLFLPTGTYAIGTAKFVLTGNLATDGNDLFSGLFNTNVDSVNNNLGLVIPDGDPSVAFNNAAVNLIPEPGTASLLGLGLVGLVLAGRRSRRS